MAGPAYLSSTPARTRQSTRSSEINLRKGIETKALQSVERALEQELTASQQRKERESAVAQHIDGFILLVQTEA